jgi:hypothetical protein
LIKKVGGQFNYAEKNHPYPIPFSKARPKNVNEVSIRNQNDNIEAFIK